MAITRAQQARQLYKNGGTMEDISFSIVKPSKDGKRPGYFSGEYGGGAGDRGGDPRGSREENERAGRTDEGNRQRAEDYRRQQNQTNIPKPKPKVTKPKPTTTPIKKPKKTKDNFKKPNIIKNYFENNLFTKGLQALKNSRLAQLNSQKQRENYLNNLQITNPELYQETIDDLEKLGYYNPDPVEYYGPESKGAARDIEQFPDLYEDQAKSILNTVTDNFDDEGNATVGTLYDDYLDTLNTPTSTGGGDNQVIDPCKGPNPPAYCSVRSNTDDDTTTGGGSDMGGLAPRFMGSIFDFSDDYGRTLAADGGIMRMRKQYKDFLEDEMDLESSRDTYFDDGRIGAQQGGNIMPRLNDLSGDVSSAEQMLQEINQRLQSAESTLGEGGGGGMFGAGNFGPGFNTNFNQQPLSREEAASNFYGSQVTQNQNQNQIQNSLNIPSTMTTPIRSRPSYEDALSDYNQRIESGMMTNDIERNKMRSRENYDNYNNNTYFQQRGSFADGGRMRQMEMMEDEDDPEGGIMDLESGRQMYFLGKLVKKATRAVKKVAKSPLGKAALMYGLGAMGGSYGAGKGFFSKGMFNPGNIMKGLIGTKGAARTPGIGGVQGLFGQLGLTKGYGGIMPTLKGGIGLGIGVPMALDALGVGKEEDDKMDLDEYYRTQGIDIDAIRNNPNRILARRFMAEGGDAEPVAKKTMPLLDMDGKEMDLRAEGGFVPLGRMERADDVPARLSKNEFVFTADAVRNAGEGDIDKGAEVMYNMMKNLESGGEVSEESQGLDGAREMFQTSQRLEEVL